MRANGCGRPFAIQPVGHRLFVLLIGAVVTQEYDIAEAMELEAARGGLEQLLESCIGDRDRPWKTHV